MGQGKRPWGKFDLFGEQGCPNLLSSGNDELYVGWHFDMRLQMLHSCAWETSPVFSAA